GHLQIQAPGYKDDLKMRQVVADAEMLSETLRRETGLDTISVRSAAFALVSSEDRSYGVQVFGVDPLHEPGVSTLPGLVSRGRFLAGRNAEEVVIGAVLARNLRVRPGDELTLLGSGRDGSFAAAVATVVGIFETGVPDIDRSIAELPIGFFDDVFYMDGAVHSVVIRVPALSAVETYEPVIEAALPAGVVLHDWNALQPGLRQAIQADMSSAFFMYGVLVILVAFSVMNTQLMSVLERTHEFGVVMSLGLTPGRLGRLVVLETSLMGLAGLALGALAGAAVTTWFTVNGFSYPGMDEMAAKFNLPSVIHPEVTLLSLFAGPAVVFIGAILSALYPALRLHWLRPVEAMRAL
ncbi:MAG: FtsX-like permease family protein, partial [Gammaproteobacteria bacterium]|nr:FtsX-like permease family protein [Gammaproteobacteria bacterium]